MHARLRICEIWTPAPARWALHTPSPRHAHLRLGPRQRQLQLLNLLERPLRRGQRGGLRLLSCYQRLGCPAMNECMDYIYPAARADESAVDASSGASSRAPSTSKQSWTKCATPNAIAAVAPQERMLTRLTHRSWMTFSCPSNTLLRDHARHDWIAAPSCGGRDPVASQLHINSDRQDVAASKGRGARKRTSQA